MGAGAAGAAEAMAIGWAMAPSADEATVDTVGVGEVSRAGVGSVAMGIAVAGALVGEPCPEWVTSDPAATMCATGTTIAATADVVCAAMEDNVGAGGVTGAKAGAKACAGEDPESAAVHAAAGMAGVTEAVAGGVAGARALLKMCGAGGTTSGAEDTVSGGSTAAAADEVLLVAATCGDTAEDAEDDACAASEIREAT